MPFTPQELQDAGKSALDYYLKNNPIDQIKQDYPLLRDLMAKKKAFPGAKEYIVEQLRVNYGSNMQFYRGEATVSYNRRQSLEQAMFPWRSAHDGLYLDEDRLAQNGIKVDDNGPGRVSRAEAIQLTDLLTEQMEILKEGYEKDFNKYLWLDGSGTADDLEGIDFLVPLDPTAGTVGNINRATAGNEYWRTNTNLVDANGVPIAAAPIAANNIITTMETAWKDCIRFGGAAPDRIYAGWEFIQAFRAEAKSELDRFVKTTTGRATIDPATDLQFNGVPITWVPQFDDNFEGADSPTIDWSRRCYMLNLNSIRLRPMQGQDMVTRKPPRPHDQYIAHWAITWKGGLTMNKSRCNAVFHI